VSGNGLWSGMSDRAVARHYHELNPAERAGLALEAAARGDERERERLVATCPRKDYRMIDGDYLDTVDASRDLAFGVVIAILGKLAQARMLAVVSELTAETLAATMACHALAEARRDANPEAVVTDFDAALTEELPKAKEAPVHHALETARAGQLSKAAAAWTAFSDVCQTDLGVEPRVVLSAHLGEEFVSTIRLDDLDGVTPGSTLTSGAKSFAAALRSTGDRRVSDPVVSENIASGLGLAGGWQRGGTPSRGCGAPCGSACGLRGLDSWVFADSMWGAWIDRIGSHDGLVFGGA
jgi:hypothetical protein